MNTAQLQTNAALQQVATNEGTMQTLASLLSDRDRQFQRDRRSDAVRATLDLVNQIERYLPSLKEGLPWPEPVEPATDEQLGILRNSLMVAGIDDLTGSLAELQKRIHSLKDRASQRASVAARIDSRWIKQLAGDVYPGTPLPSQEMLRHDDEQRAKHKTLRILEDQCRSYVSQVRRAGEELRQEALRELPPGT